MSTIGIPSNNSLRHNLLTQFDQRCMAAEPRSGVIAAIVTIAKCILLFIPYIIATTLDLLWWVAKTITIIDAYRTGLAHIVHLINILASFILGFALFVGIRQRTHKAIPDRTPIIERPQPTPAITPHAPATEARRTLEELDINAEDPFESQLATVTTFYQAKINKKEPLYFDCLQSLVLNARIFTKRQAYQVAQLIEKLVAEGADVNAKALMRTYASKSFLYNLTGGHSNNPSKNILLKTLIKLGANCSGTGFCTDEVIGWVLDNQSNPSTKIDKSVLERCEFSGIGKSYHGTNKVFDQRFDLHTCLEHGYINVANRILAHPNVIPENEKEKDDFFNDILATTIACCQLNTFRHFVNLWRGGVDWAAKQIIHSIGVLKQADFGDLPPDQATKTQMLDELRTRIQTTARAIHEHPDIMKMPLRDPISLVLGYLIPEPLHAL